MDDLEVHQLIMLEFYNKLEYHRNRLVLLQALSPDLMDLRKSW